MSKTEDFYPLSPLQEGILAQSRTAPQRDSYVEVLSWEMEGTLDLHSFAQAWQWVVEKHPALRTYFLWEGLKQPVQIVLDRAELPFFEVDFRQLEESEQNSRWDRT